MKAFVLSFAFFDGRKSQIARVYLPESKAKADSDFEMLSEHASCDRAWELTEVDIV